jgi:lysozyme
MAYDLQKLQDELIRDEGLRLTAYRDTLGHLTIGVGHLILRGEHFTTITREQAMALLDQDIAIAERRLSNIFPSWRSIDEVRQLAMLNLTFNLGYKLAAFKRFLHAAKFGDWEKAADQLMQSRWYKQVKLRGPRIVHAIRTGTEWSGV